MKLHAKLGVGSTLTKVLVASGHVALCAASLGVFGAGCLTRPVTTQPPTTKTNFTAVVRQAAVDKVDLLFAIDNSASMGDKQVLLSQAVPDLLNRLITPNCVDDNGNVLGTTTDGKCAQGKAEFQPVHDMHIGIVTSSMGGYGADICQGTDQAGAGATRHDNDHGQLINRASKITGTSIDPAETTTPDIEASNYLAWLPDVDANKAKSDPGAVKNAPQLVNDFIEAIGGVHEYGCGIEAQLESWYHFLIQPDPYQDIVPDPKDGRKRTLSGVNGTILQQRHDFLRPDSLVAVIVLTDEDDSAADPRGVGGQGWAYANSKFPGSVGGGAARGTKACDNYSTVNTADCTSCGFSGHASDPNCQLPGDVDSQTNQPQPGYYPYKHDTLNTRFVRLKQRYGVDPQFPVSRYVNGLKSTTVPDRNGEVYNGVGSDGKPNNSYNATANCRNPLFAQNLPTDPNKELCKLQPGPRDPSLVFFAAITGVPWQLLTQNPKDANSPFLSSIPTDRWIKLVGNDPHNYDLSGQDIHMVQSIDPRTGQAGSYSASTDYGDVQPTGSSDTTDPFNGREWDTGGGDLQYACTFQLPAPKDCTDPKYAGACDCNSTSGPRPPLCDPNKPTTQIRGKAYPGVRQLTVVRDLGDQGIVASICPRTLDTNSQDYGFRPAVRAIVDRLKNALASQCLPQQLTAGAACGDVPCLILETLPNPGPESDCTKYPGLQIPDPTVLAKFRDQQRAEQGSISGDAGPGFVDETKLPVCQLTQLVNGGAKPGCATPLVQYPGDFDANGSCFPSGAAGWCYATGKAAGTCPQAILFSGNGQPQVGAKVSLQCIEASGAGGDAGP